MATASPQAEPGIDFPTLMEKVGFKPHSDGQKDYLFSTTRFNVPCCGRRWGKSQATGHRLTYKSFVPDSYNWIVGPTYRLAEKEFRVAWRDYEQLGLLKYCKKSYNVKQGDMKIITPWGAHIECVSAEKQDSLLGEGLSHAVMSEAAKHHRSTWEQYIEPALSDLLGSADFPSTPQGFNWFHGLWLLGKSNAGETYHPDYKSWSFPSWTNAVRYPGGADNSEIQRIKSIVSKTWFDQEYGASFTAITGSIYEEWDENVHVQRCEYDPSLPNYLALDYGWTNPFVALDIQINPATETAYVWREYFLSYKSTYEHGEYLKTRDNPPGYHVDGYWGDARGADEAATLSLILDDYIASDTEVSWKQGTEQIKRMLKAGKLFVDPSCINLIREMPQLHIKPISRQSTQDLDEKGQQGNIQHKVDDHAVDALRYLIGPMFVLGFMNASFADAYGQTYQGSESQDFFTTLVGAPDMTLETEVSLRSNL